MYDSFAGLYDSLTFDVEYEKIADFAAGKIRAHKPDAELVLDLACGTGTLTRLLSLRGFDMIGVDFSAEMLSAAKDKTEDESILYLLQDIREFELYGTVDAIICSLDGLNYLLGDGELEAVFRLCHNYLNPDGLLLFDINSEYKFKHVFAENTFVFETEEVFYTWENSFDEKTRLCDFFLTFFVKNKNGSYDRLDEEQTERAYSAREVESALAAAGFEIKSVCDGYGGGTVKPGSERVVYECVKSK